MGTNHPKKSVVIVDAHTVMREGIKAMLLSDGRCDVAIATGSATEARQWIAASKPDMVILDPELRGSDGLALSREIGAEHPRVPIMVVSKTAEYEKIVAAFKAGVKGHAVKESSLDVLKHGVLQVLEGDYFLDGPSAEVVVKRLVGREESLNDREDELFKSLTKREQDILRFLAWGLSNQTIAERLEISAKTVSNHRANLMKKLGFESYPELVRYACRIGLVDPKLWEQ